MEPDAAERAWLAAGHRKTDPLSSDPLKSHESILLARSYFGQGYEVGFEAGVAASPSHATIIENRQAGVESGTLVASPADSEVLRAAAEIVEREWFDAQVGWIHVWSWLGELADDLAARGRTDGA